MLDIVSISTTLYPSNKYLASKSSKVLMTTKSPFIVKAESYINYTIEVDKIYFYLQLLTREKLAGLNSYIDNN